MGEAWEEWSPVLLFLHSLFRSLPTNSALPDSILSCVSEEANWSEYSVSLLWEEGGGDTVSREGCGLVSEGRKQVLRQSGLMGSDVRLFPSRHDSDRRVDTYSC